MRAACLHAQSLLTARAACRRRVNWGVYALLALVAVGGWWLSSAPAPLYIGPRVAWEDMLSLPPSVSLPWSHAACNTSLHDVTFIFMASSKALHLHAAQRHSWLRDAPHVYAFADVDGEYVRTLPQLAGWSDREGAQHRQLRGMQWLLQRANATRTRWYMLVDDDTWVNVPVLLRFITAAQRLHSQRALLGYRYGPNGVFNGGAGLLLSAPGFEAIAGALYDSCPFIRANDDTITLCARSLGGFTFMHSSIFSWYPTHLRSYADFMEMLTIHGVKDAPLQLRLTNDVAQYCQQHNVHTCCPTGGTSAREVTDGEAAARV